MENNVLEVLRKAATKERKRRAVAIVCLEELTKQLAEAFSPLMGDGFDGSGYNAIHSITNDLYFRYKRHEGAENYELEGFYFDPRQNQVWGKEITFLQGKDFWHQVARILAWVDELPDLLSRLESSRNLHFMRLKKIIAAIQAI